MRNIINTTPHSIRFQNGAGEVYEVPPCGVIISAKPLTEEGNNPLRRAKGGREPAAVGPGFV